MTPGWRKLHTILTQLDDIIELVPEIDDTGLSDPEEHMSAALGQLSEMESPAKRWGRAAKAWFDAPSHDRFGAMEIEFKKLKEGVS